MNNGKIATLEALELRAYLSVSINAQGWTVFGDTSDTHAVYVSSSTGNDRNSGRKATEPVKTLARGESLMRDGHGDWLLLKAGDVWHETLQGWDKSGKSADEPAVITSYGRGERPVLLSGNRDGFTTAAVTIKHLAISGLFFYAETRDPNSRSFVDTSGGYGLHTLHSLDDLLIENCIFADYKYNLSIEGHFGPAGNVRLRRNIIVDAYNTAGQAEGMYASHINGLLLEDNLFDHNGWNEKIPGAQATVFNHNAYLADSNSDVIVRGNTFARASSHGLQIRSGGKVQGNLFLNNPIGMLFGIGHLAKAGGAVGDISGNVFLGTASINGQNRGWGLEIGNIKPGGTTVVYSNIFAHDTLNHYPAMVISGGQAALNEAETTGVQDLRIEGNIVYRWNSGISIDKALVSGGTGPNGLSGLTVINNDFQRLASNVMVTRGGAGDPSVERWGGNRYFNDGDSRKWFKRDGQTVSWDAWYGQVENTSRRVRVKYNDPERDIASYTAAMGLQPSLETFLSIARMESQRTFDPRFLAGSVLEYMRQGFKVRRIPPTVTATNLSSRNTRPTRSAISFYFSQDVSQSLKVEDLVIRNRLLGYQISPEAMHLEYDKATNRATWTFPGLRRDMLAAGDWQVTLQSNRITDIKGTMLDGNYDGAGGDNFSRRLKIKPVV